jgi:hypothetical protein
VQEAVPRHVHVRPFWADVRASLIFSCSPSFMNETFFLGSCFGLCHRRLFFLADIVSPLVGIPFSAVPGIRKPVNPNENPGEDPSEDQEALFMSYESSRLRGAPLGEPSKECLAAEPSGHHSVEPCGPTVSDEFQHLNARCLHSIRPVDSLG